MTDVYMRFEPCSDGMFSWLAADPAPYPDLAGQLDYREIARLETVEVVGEYL